MTKKLFSFVMLLLSLCGNAQELAQYDFSAVCGAASGASAGFITGSGNAWASGASFGQGLKSGLVSGGIGAASGALAGGLYQGIVDYRHGFDFWYGLKYNEFLLPSSSSQYTQTDYNNSSVSYVNDEILKSRIYDEYGIIEGNYNISTITTRTNGNYKLSTKGVYVNPSTGNSVGGYTLSYSKGFSEIHISPLYTNSNIVKFKAVAGHELIHAYHHYSLPLSFNRRFSEMVAYRYTFNVYIQNGCYRDAFNTINTAICNGFLGNAPSEYIIPYMLKLH